MKKQVIPAALLLLSALLIKGCSGHASPASPSLPLLAAQPAAEISSPLLPLPPLAASPVPPDPSPETAPTSKEFLPLSEGAAAERTMEQAEFSKTDDDGTFTYALYDCYAAVTGFSASFSPGEKLVSLQIPAVYGELPVRVIGVGAFDASRGILLKSVTFPEGLWQIEARAFLDQHYLRSAALPDSILYVGEMAFVCRDSQESHFPVLTLDSIAFIPTEEEFVNEKRFDASR